VVIGSTKRRTSRRGLRIGALIMALVLSAGGLTLAALAGAQDHPSARQGAYPPNPCSPTQSIYAKITKHPKKRTTSHTATFKFKALFCFSGSEVQGAEFKCKLDDGNSKKCTSPKRYRHLKHGKHHFKVTPSAFGSKGKPDSFSWKVR